MQGVISSHSFAGLEKDVLLLSKSSPDQPFSSFMGKGIIPLSPDFVFNSLRNPQLRFTYDNMLKVGCYHDYVPRITAL